MRAFAFIALTICCTATVAAQQPTQYRNTGYSRAPIYQPNYQPEQYMSPAQEAQPPVENAAVGNSYVDQGSGQNCVQSCGNSLGCGDGCGGNSAYIQVFGGWVESQNLNIDPDPTQQQQFSQFPDYDISLNSGWMIGAARGQRLNACWRAEVESAYRDATVGELLGGGGAAPVVITDLDGRLSLRSGMFNVLRDLAPRGRRSDLKPYIGGGAGFAFIDLESSFVGGGAGGTGTFDADGSAFAFQGILGVSRRVRPCLDVFAEYRLFGTDDFSVTYEGNAGNGQTRVDFDTSFLSHNFLFGLRLWTR
jgi:opacity protein-like surface antigen